MSLSATQTSVYVNTNLNILLTVSDLLLRVINTPV